MKFNDFAATTFLLCLILSMFSCTANQLIETRANYVELKKLEDEINDEDFRR
jgi:hypothetical protein